MNDKAYIVGKILEALGSAALLIAFVVGVYGDAWGELYLFIGGIIVFFAGRRIEKRSSKRNTAADESATLNTNL